MTIATKTTVDRELEIAAAFATNLLAAVARALESNPDAVLAAAGTKGRPAREVELRAAYRALAVRCFPGSANAPRKLLDLVSTSLGDGLGRMDGIGESGPRPLWQDLAGLEVGLGVTSEQLFSRAGPRGLRWPRPSLMLERRSLD